MKKLLFIAIGAMFSSGLSAQKLASKDVEKKNVVLEEFTGKTCGYCPDGHKRGDEFSAANPGDVVLINIHCGSYGGGVNANPDYNVWNDKAAADNWGNTLYGHPDVKLIGFPSGVVNRTNFPGYEQQRNQQTPNPGATAQSRGTWATTGATVLAEDSPVNVGVKGTYDPAKFKLYIEVEAYYTSDELNATNMINVGIMQDGIYGPQSGGSNYYPAKMKDGKYRHDHMLRAVLTGQWGETIDKTTKGSLFTKVYEYDVPEKLNDVDMVPTDLLVYAFVAEGQQGIISGKDVHVVEGTDPRLDGVSVSELNGAVSGVNVYPNPTTGNTTLRVNSDNAFSATIKVVSVTGAVVSNSSVNVGAGNNEIAIDMNSLENGTYFVEVSSQEGIVTRQSIVKK